MDEKKLKIIGVVGARPNFMKIGPVLDALGKKAGVETLLVHTGQHYDEKMSKVFFEELGLPKPEINLEIGSGPHGRQTGRIMAAFEEVLEERRPGLVMVVGDVNSTLACSLAAVKLKIPVAHIEAGLRSGDRTMPEEINRIVTDTLSDYLFVTERSGVENLRAEGIPDSRIFLVGNVMIDNLVRNLERIDRMGIVSPVDSEAGGDGYAALTLHRPSNVDDADVFGGIAAALADVAERLPVYFPVHPRTREKIAGFGLGKYFRDYEPGLKSGILMTEPMGALVFLSLMRKARLVLTDSGGIQEETTFLGIPCVTIRENTERPVTIEEGTNVLVGTDPEAIRRAAFDILGGRAKIGRVPDLWDGRAAERIADVLAGGFIG